MEQLTQIRQLSKDGIPIREIARRTGISRNAVKRYLHRLEPDTEDAGDLTGKQLADKAYNNASLSLATSRQDALISHFSYAEKELRRTGVDRQILWVEYKEQHPNGYSYSRYCYHLDLFLKHTDVTMHLEYEAGDMMMIDFAGKKLRYTNPDGGEVISVETFVAILPYSGLIFCTVVQSQKTPDFIACINAMLKFYGAVPKTILCDNLKTAVKRPSTIEPVFTDICYQLSDYYQTSFSATRPYKPRDKAMVEGAVKIVYTNIYAPLRDEVFLGLAELQQAVHKLLLVLNDKPYKNNVYSRLYYFEQYERAALKLLHQQSFTPKNVVIRKVTGNYHILLPDDKVQYSVPYTYCGKSVSVLYDSRTVEIYYEHERIVMHMRKCTVPGYVTMVQHMPSNHQNMQERKGWTKEGLLLKADKIGPYTHLAAAQILDNGCIIEQNYKACNGMIMLEKRYTRERLEAACRRATNGTRVTYNMIKSILEKCLDKQALLFDNNPLPAHENIRGGQAYQ